MSTNTKARPFANLSQPSAESASADGPLPAGVVKVRGTDGNMHLVDFGIAPPAAVNPFTNALPSPEDVARLVSDQTAAYERVIALTVESAAIPGMWAQAVADADAAEMARLAGRKAQLPHERMLTDITMAKARLAVCQARHAVALAARDEASAALHADGPMGGYANGRDKADVAGARHNDAAMVLHEAGISLADAQRAVDHANAAAAYGGR
jgi:hypothetical protein